MPGGDGGRPGDGGHGDRGEDPAEEVAPPRQGGGPPALQNPGFPGADEADAVGVPSGKSEAEDGVAGDVGVGGLGVALMRGDEQDDREPDADDDGPAASQQAGLIADLGGQAAARRPGSGA